MSYLSLDYEGPYVSPLRRQKRQRNSKYGSLSKYFAGVTTGSYKQDISFMLVGKKGTGKSVAALTIGYHTARRIAEIVDHDPDNWEDYFNIDHVAIIESEAACEIMSHASKYDILDYDDVAVGWNARDFNSKDNKARNDIFQINRIDQTTQIFTLPDQFLIDKVPRSLVSHYGEMYSADFNRGISTLKFFKPITLHRTGKQIQPFLSMDRVKYIRHVVRKNAPQSLYDEYDRRRARITKEQIQIRKDKMSDAEPERKATSVDQRRFEMDNKIQAYLGVYDLKIGQGMKGSEANKETCAELDLPLPTVASWKRAGHINRVRKIMSY